MLAAFAMNREEIKSLAGSTNLMEFCTEFPFPGSGELTGWEWLHFLNCHTIRHTRQMKNILSIVKQNR